MPRQNAQDVDGVAAATRSDSKARTSSKTSATPPERIQAGVRPVHSIEDLTEKTLPLAIGELFELNNYSVEYGQKIHGAEIDIIATPKAAFGSTIYIEATIQYVDNTKYGKDLTKFTLLREMDRGCACICASTKGFTPDVQERAKRTGIELRTYQELFRLFEKFAPYVESTLSQAGILTLIKAYEEPYFRDTRGEHLVTAWLNEWKSDPNLASNWLVILGEYGTGKTALTLKMQHDWLAAYRSSPDHPIPLRIELRNFSRQFDARALLHHFLDTNSLGHIPIDFLLHLIRNKRVILLLDGYDEMAQFLNARERRACLAALADLANQGAKGILTSRPNYFTEAEELNVFDALYATIEQNDYYLGQMDKLFLTQEKTIDSLLERYLISKNERFLRDLTKTQTQALVRRKLDGDAAGQTIVLNLLDRIFREESDGSKQSLSGKPVIISYLLELIEFLQAPDQSAETLSEWQIYKMIVDRLMLRDLQRSPTMLPDHRRQALQRLAIILSGKSVPGATEDIFFSIIDELFRTDLRRLTGEEYRSRRDELFQDLRSSATLTRSERSTPSIWQFSHNSLREFLVAEAAVAALHVGQPLDISFPVSRAMRSFVTALPSALANSFFESLSALWPKRATYALGGTFGMGFDLLRNRPPGLRATLSQLMKSGEGRLELSDMALKEIEFKSADLGDKVQFMCRNSTLTDVVFRDLDMTGSDFEGTTFDRCSFIKCSLEGASFKSTLVFECNLNDVALTGCDFTSIDTDSNIVAANADGDAIVLTGRNAIGYLKFHGGITDEVSAYYELQHDSRFPIVFKICERIAEQRNSQLRGLTQRGAAQANPPFARDFVNMLLSSKLIEIGGNNLVSATPEGRRQLPRLISFSELPQEIESFLRSSR